MKELKFKKRENGQKKSLGKATFDLPLLLYAQCRIHGDDPESAIAGISWRASSSSSTTTTCPPCVCDCSSQALLSIPIESVADGCFTHSDIVDSRSIWFLAGEVNGNGINGSTEEDIGKKGTVDEHSKDLKSFSPNDRGFHCRNGHGRLTTSMLASGRHSIKVFMLTLTKHGGLIIKCERNRSTTRYHHKVSCSPLQRMEDRYGAAWEELK
ncbi:hypothetical protein F8388_002494 [Cannabis sativa]|uniref:Uncharacterized protein n=1 Tax=Cannabis sativa TaxID=3483 RepID=A0A7J6DUJ1_CANSA|nr:hypothetical protein F8388_002494 [Cannabis sativa]